MAYKKIQIKRGTKNGMPNLRSGEPGFTQDEHSFYIGTGATNKRFLNEEQTKVELDKKVMKTIYDEKINGIDLKNNNQDSEIQLIKNKNIEQDNKLIQLEEKNIELDTNLDNKVKLDGESKSNYNFIPNEVVQDGLIISDEFNTPINIEEKTVKRYNNPHNNVTIFFVCDTDLTSEDTTYQIICGLENDLQAPGVGYIAYEKAKRIHVMNFLGSDMKFERIGSDYIGGKIVVCVNWDMSNNTVDLIINNKTISVAKGKIGKLISLSPLYSINNSYLSKKNLLSKVFIYNHVLTPQEIQHNFSVLNNPQSVSALETTDSAGTKVKHLFHSDSQVVSMRDERTLNEFANEVLDWEEKTADASGKIEVGNCKRAWLRNFSIEGNSKVFKRVKGSTGEWVAIANDESRDTTQFDYKLESTQAIISNVGMKSVFYASEEDKVNEKVIELSGIGGVGDTLTLNDDGSGVWENVCISNVLNGNERWSFRDDMLSDNFYVFQTTLYILSKTGTIISELFDTYNMPINPIKEGICNTIWDGKTLIKISISKSKTDGTVEGFKDYIKINNVTFMVAINTPIITHIPKELMPVVTTNQTNNLSVDSPVQPSSFKATIPVDKVAILETELKRIASIVDTPKNIALLDNYVEDEYNKNQKENQTIEGVM